MNTRSVVTKLKLHVKRERERERERERPAKYTGNEILAV